MCEKYMLQFFLVMKETHCGFWVSSVNVLFKSNNLCRIDHAVSPNLLFALHVLELCSVS